MNQRFRGGLATGSAGLAYSLDRETVGVGASVASTARYYPGASNRLIRREYASVGTSAVLGAGFSAQAGARYQPYSLRSLTPWLTDPQLVDPAIVDEDFPASAEHYFGYSAGVDYTRRLTSRTTFSSGYDYSGRERLREAGRFDRHTAGASISRSLGRDLSLQLGYRYSEARYGAGEGHVNHLIDVGVNYNHALSFSRRTTLSFSTGTSASRSARSEALRYRATGSARLNHEMGRTWNAGVSYDRGLRYTETWPEPIFSDSATAGLAGLLNRRTQLQFAATGIRGRGRQGVGNGIESYAATAGLTVAATRHINTGLTYTYYTHRFGSGVALPPGFTPDLDRRSIRAFVSLWAPLFQRARRP
jgi:hypothetical protein